MANANHRHMSSSGQGKGSGAGGMTELPEGTLGENQVLSNRDKSRHNEARGLDGAAVQTEQYHDHAANRFADEEGAKAPAGDEEPAA